MTTIDQLRDQLKRDPEPPLKPEKSLPVIGVAWSPASIAILDDKRMCEFKFCFEVARWQSDDDNTCACSEHANDECWSGSLTQYEVEENNAVKVADNVEATVSNDNDDWVEVEAAKNGYCQEMMCSGELATRKRGDLLVCKWCADLIDEAEAEAEEDPDPRFEESVE